MQTRHSTSAYQDASASGATLAGLMQLVYSHLAQDLLRAADAVQNNNIATRCAASNHALLLLGHLESWVNELDEPPLAESLHSFYRMLVTSILQLQATPSESGFRQYAQLVLDTRAAWQKRAESLVDAVSQSAFAQSHPGAEGFSFHA